MFSVLWGSVNVLFATVPIERAPGGPRDLFGLLCRPLVRLKCTGVHLARLLARRALVVILHLFPSAVFVTGMIVLGYLWEFPVDRFGGRIVG